MSNYVENKVIIITGAGSDKGFGRIAAEKLALMGAKVVLSDINAEGLEVATADIKAKGGDVASFVSDVSKYAEQEALVKFTVEKYGRLDVFIANAGIMPNAGWSSHAKAIEAWDKCVDINLKGVIHGISASYDQMFAQEGGAHFIVVSSIYANFPVFGSGVYQATKIGVRYLANTLRQEAKGKIRVTIINPTGIPTNLNNTIVDNTNSFGVIGWNMSEAGARYKMSKEGTLPAEYTDRDSIQNTVITAGDLADSIVYAINQPMGLVIGEVTVRSANELHIL